MLLLWAIVYRTYMCAYFFSCLLRERTRHSSTFTIFHRHTAMGSDDRNLQSVLKPCCFRNAEQLCKVPVEFYRKSPRRSIITFRKGNKSKEGYFTETKTIGGKESLSHEHSLFFQLYVFSYTLSALRNCAFLNLGWAEVLPVGKGPQPAQILYFIRFGLEERISHEVRFFFSFLPRKLQKGYIQCFGSGEHYFCLTRAMESTHGVQWPRWQDVWTCLLGWQFSASTSLFLGLIHSRFLSPSLQYSTPYIWNLHFTVQTDAVPCSCLLPDRIMFA